MSPRSRRSRPRHQGQSSPSHQSRHRLWLVSIGFYGREPLPISTWTDERRRDERLGLFPLPLHHALFAPRHRPVLRPSTLRGRRPGSDSNPGWIFGERKESHGGCRHSPQRPPVSDGSTRVTFARYMLPASWRLFSDSKSNSSTLFPSTTTTRVSSAWVASISIFLAISLSLHDSAKSALVPGGPRADLEIVSISGRFVTRRQGRAGFGPLQEDAQCSQRASSRFFSDTYGLKSGRLHPFTSCARPRPAGKGIYTGPVSGVQSVCSEDLWIDPLPVSVHTANLVIRESDTNARHLDPSV